MPPLTQALALARAVPPSSEAKREHVHPFDDDVGLGAELDGDGLGAELDGDAGQSSGDSSCFSLSSDQ
jgi:hypothetical protein